MDTKQEQKYSQLLIACITYGAGSDGKITKTKLAKLAYLADFAYFYYNLKPIIGLDYKKLDQGPVPYEFFYILEELEGDVLDIEHKKNAHLVSIKNPTSMNLLSEEEHALIKKVCEKWKDKSTDEIVTFTHDQLPWKISRSKESIPYELIVQENSENVY